MSDEAAPSKLLSWMIGVYFLGVSFSAIYFNWQYAASHGFVQWFLLGEIVPTAKSLVWPYFVFGMDAPSSGPSAGASSAESTSQPASRAVAPAEWRDHDREAISRFNEVTRMRTEELRFNAQYDQYPPGQIPPDALDKMKSYQDNMLAAGQGIDIEVLNSAFPELGNRFRNEFLRGLVLVIDFENAGIAARNSGSSPPVPTAEMSARVKAGEELLREWQGWYDSHYDEMLAALKKKWGPER